MLNLGWLKLEKNFLTLEGIKDFKMKTSRIQLSRLIITGTIDLTTPLIVLKEIVLSHDIKILDQDWKSSMAVFQIIQKILNTEVYEISESYLNNQEMLKHIATFVNPRVRWPVKDLVRAFDYLRGFMTNLVYPNDDFDIGLQEPDAPYRLNACVLYGLCRKYGINVRYAMTLEDMAQSIRLYRRVTSLENRNI